MMIRAIDSAVSGQKFSVVFVELVRFIKFDG